MTTRKALESGGTCQCSQRLYRIRGFDPEPSKMGKGCNEDHHNAVMNYGKSTRKPTRSVNHSRTISHAARLYLDEGLLDMVPLTAQAETPLHVCDFCSRRACCQWQLLVQSYQRPRSWRDGHC